MLCSCIWCFQTRLPFFARGCHRTSVPCSGFLVRRCQTEHVAQQCCHQSLADSSKSSTCFGDSLADMSRESHIIRTRNRIVLQVVVHGVSSCRSSRGSPQVRNTWHVQQEQPDCRVSLVLGRVHTSPRGQMFQTVREDSLSGDSGLRVREDADGKAKRII
jgi:hypothetical protein